MAQFNYAKSFNISNSITNYIINKVHKSYADKLRMEALFTKSHENTKQQPNQYTQKLLKMYTFVPTHKRCNNGSQDLKPPKSPDHKNIKIIKSAIQTPRIKAELQKTNTTIASSCKIKEDIQPQKKQLLVPLKEKMNGEDPIIESLRIKKQKLHKLQLYFQKSERQSSIRQKLNAVKESEIKFTTDFNGDKIDIKPRNLKKGRNPYVFIEIGTHIKQQRDDNKLYLTQLQLDENEKKLSKTATSQNFHQQRPQLVTLKDLSAIINKQHIRKLTQKQKSRLQKQSSLNYIRCI